MSDSGFSQFPTRPPAPGQSVLPPKAEVKAPIIVATGKLARVDTPRTIIGEVTKIDKDGTVEVKTEDGTLTLKPRDRVVPAEGQKVEIDVAPGAPPKQAVLRPAPAPVQTPQPPQPQQPDIPVRPAPAPTTQSPDKPVTRPPMDQATQANLNQQQAQRPDAPRSLPTPTTPQPLPENAIVRLTPLPPAQAKQLVDQIIQMIQVKALTTAFLSTQAVQSVMTQELNTLIPALPKPTVQNIVQQVTTALAAKAPLTNLNDIVNGTITTTALTPSIQPMRSPVENFMRQVLTQGSVFTPQPSPVLSTQIMMPPANISFPAHVTGHTPAAEILTVKSVTIPGVPVDQPVTTTPALKVNSFIDAKVQNFTPVNATIAPMTGKAPAAPLILQPTVTAPTMTAQVITVTPQQFPVISLMMPGIDNPQLFTLNFPATNLVPGSSLTVLPQPTASAPLPATPPTAFELMTGFRWPVFDEFMDLTNIQFPNAPSTQTLANILPNPAQPGKMPAAALLFIAAAKAGDLNAWLGEKNIDVLRRVGKADFIARMSREFAGLRKLSSEPVTPEWRGMSIPMYSDGQVDKIHIYYRHSDHGNDRDEEQAQKGKGTRFIMDLNLSHMGPVQLDGYSRGNQLDLAVRTQKPFGAGARYEMTRRYIKALESAGFEGQLLFQSQPDKFIQIAMRPDLISASI